MIKRLLDKVAPRRAVTSDGGYRRLLRWTALPVTDRRWAAPLCAIALGFGLFAGVAIGPGAAGTLAGAPIQLLEVPSLGGNDEEPVEEEFAEAPESSGDFGEVEESPPFAATAPIAEEAFATETGETPSPVRPAHEEREEKPEEPEEQLLTGTVVHVNPEAGSYTVAEIGGTMSTVHAGKLLAPGSKLEVPIRSLANGTLAEAGSRKRTGETAKAELAGIVTYVGSDPAAPVYTLSNRGVSALIHMQSDPSGAPPTLPELGAYATVSVDIEEGTLQQRELSSAGAPFTHAEIAGIVGPFDSESRVLLVSADDVRESGQDVSLVVPAEIDATALVPGDSVLVSVDIGADGSLALTGLASDERLKGADDAKSTQGDLVPEKEGGKG